MLADLEQFELSVCSIFKCNVDYSGSQTTWGCHESYLHRVNQHELSEQIIPHLVSRIIYSGAGGFDPFSPGIAFTLSPRVWHISNAVSHHSTRDRGIFHTKDEPLAKEGYHRLHVICGESLSSETAMWLKVATTALVVAIIEAGLRPGDEVELYSPVSAMRKFASDPQCTAMARLKNGRGLSAIEIQCHYLEMAERCLNGGPSLKSSLPEWAEAVCHEWRKMLNLLLDAPESVDTTLDWAIKRALYINRARGRGISWESLPAWNEVAARLHYRFADAIAERGENGIEKIVNSDRFRQEMKWIAPLLVRRSIDFTELPEFLKLRQELFEIDMKFGQLGGQGIFAALDRAGVLNHHLPGVERVYEAVTKPPDGSRAFARGAFIKNRAAEPVRYQCDWKGVWDKDGNLVLDLSDPFQTEARKQQEGIVDHLTNHALRS
jgi:proteasome accessory factor A